MFVVIYRSYSLDSYIVCYILRRISRKTYKTIKDIQINLFEIFLKVLELKYPENLHLHFQHHSIYVYSSPATKTTKILI